MQPIYMYIIYSLEQIWSCLDTAARRRVCAQLAKEHLSLILIVQYAASSLPRGNASESESGYTCELACVRVCLSMDMLDSPVRRPAWYPPGAAHR